MAPATLTHVADGDTITCTLDECSELFHIRIRLVDIDAPEHGEQLHLDARLELAHLLNHRKLELELARDHHGIYAAYNRTPAYVWCQGKLAQEELVRAGLAVVWAPRGPSQHTEALRTAELIARQAELGVWSLPCHRLHRVHASPRRRRGSH